MRVLRSFGGSWEDWEDQLTLDRFKAIIASEEDIPPLYVTAYLVALGLGIAIDKVWGPKAKKDAVPEISENGFLAEFGMSGTLTGSM